MRRILSLLLGVALVAASITIGSLSSQCNGLNRELRESQKTAESLRTTYEKYRTQSEEKTQTLTQERDALAAQTVAMAAEKEALTQDNQRLTEALRQARTQAAAIMGAKTLAEQATLAAQAQTTAARKQADQWEVRLGQVLTLLTTPEPSADATLTPLS